jgi:hypothetical protein
MIMYKLVKNPFTGKLANQVIRIEDGAYIPFAKANTDYQAYLKWVSEGNTPLPADEVA